MQDRSKLIAFALIAALVGLGIWGAMHANDVDEANGFGTACTIVAVRSGELPPNVIKRAVSEMRDQGKVTSPVDLGNVGAAALTLVHQFGDGVVVAGTQVEVCASSTHVQKINQQSVDE